MTIHEPRWTETDRAYVRALLDYRDNTCPSCGRQADECQDPKKAGTWQAIARVCEPTRMVHIEIDNAHEANRRQRGVLYATRRTPGVI